MWQRFSERARKLIFYSQEEAQRFGESYVSTEHLLLGLIREPDCVGARALERMSINLNRVRAEVEKQLPRGDNQVIVEMQLTPRAKRVIDLAYDEARQLGNNWIGTEHILLALIRESEGLAGRVLTKLGADIERTRQEVTAIQAGDISGKEEKSVPQARRVEKEKSIITEGFEAKRLTQTFSSVIEKVYSDLVNEKGKRSLPEELLLALLQDSNAIAVQLLKRFDVDVDALKADVEKEVEKLRSLGQGSVSLPTGADILELAVVDAVFLKHRHIGTEHLLLGLLLDKGFAGQKLNALGLSYDDMRKAVAELYEP